MIRSRRGVLALGFCCACLSGCALQPAVALAQDPPSPTAGTTLPSPTYAPLPSATPPPSPSSTPTELPLTRLLFTGDINPSRCVAAAVLASGDPALPFRLVADRLRSADIAIGSLDGSLSDISAPTPCDAVANLNLIGPARLAEGLQFAGFDVITIATNHVKNCGSERWMCDQALFDTLHSLHAAGIATTGGGAALASARAPAAVTRHGVRFAFLGISRVGSEMWATADTAGTAPLSAGAFEEVLRAIALARREADVVIVLPQWGDEYDDQPSAQQRAWARGMVAAGATLVIGNQAHVTQGIEEFPGGLAAYALGNFVFDQGPSLVRRQSVVLEAEFRGSQLAGWKLWPARIYHQHQPRWVEGEEAEAIVGRVAELSAELAPPYSGSP